MKKNECNFYSILREKSLVLSDGLNYDKGNLVASAVFPTLCPSEL